MHFRRNFVSKLWKDIYKLILLSALLCDLKGIFFLLGNTLNVLLYSRGQKLFTLQIEEL